MESSKLVVVMKPGVHGTKIIFLHGNMPADAVTQVCALILVPSVKFIGTVKPAASNTLLFNISDVEQTTIASTYTI
jgi:hypothetical protein